MNARFSPTSTLYCQLSVQIFNLKHEVACVPAVQCMGHLIITLLFKNVGWEDYRKNYNKLLLRNGAFS